MARKYTEEEKARVFVALTVSEGNVKRSARETGVPVSTVRLWKKEWERNGPSPELLEAAESEAGRFVADAERTRDKALAEYEKKVEAGEVSAKDLITGVGILTDKINLAKGLATSRTDSNRPALDPATLRELAAGAVQGVLEAARSREQEIEEAEWEQVELKTLPSPTQEA